MYFVVAEALANVAKHARAGRGKVTIVRGAGCVTVEVEDDGVGGARLDGGSGLRGLVDRVGALDGRLLVDDRARSGNPAPRGDSMRVVIADDSALLRQGLARLLDDAGVDVAGRLLTLRTC